MNNYMFTAYMQFVKLADKERKIDAYEARAIAGYYKPFEALKTKSGSIRVYLNETRGIVNSPDNRRAQKFIQGKNSLNVTSVFVLDVETCKDYFVAYGQPPRAEVYGKEKRPNPFHDNKDDGFLFVISKDWRFIEMLVVDGGCNTILGNAKALADGEYNEMLERLRATAQPLNSL